MSIYEVNRNTVQRRLDLRKAQRQEAQRNAAQEAADAAFRAEISKKAHAHRAEIAAAEEAQRRENARKEAEARQRKRQAEQEKRYCLYWLLYAGLTILPMLIATILVVVHEYGWLPTWVMAPIGIALCAFSIFNFVDLAPWLDQETVKQVAATFRRKFLAYMLTPYSEQIPR